jgi:hypothetical protein
MVDIESNYCIMRFANRNEIIAQWASLRMLLCAIYNIT